MTISNLSNSFWIQCKELYYSDDVMLEGETQIGNIIDFLGIPKPNKVLDLCCGIGRHTLPLAKLGASVVGIDIDHYQLEHARKETALFNDKITFYQREMHELHLSEKFDVILSLQCSFGLYQDEKKTNKLL